MISQLPPEFCQRMEHMLGEEYPAFLESQNQPALLGLRVNTRKISPSDFEKLVPFPVEKIPWVENGYYYEADSRPARCPLYQAGLYYLQEPSAMTPACRLPVLPGERVLDLCAAPGGKATALGEALKGQGLLAANDISLPRARALLRNLELFGIPNLLVTAESPDKLCKRFPEYFHKILLDAPCSGEGMFRRDPAMAKDWTLEKSKSLSQIQRQLILQAEEMLLPGGLLLYSTCTFAPEEDEGTVSYLLEQRPEMELADIAPYEGFSSGVPEFGNGNPELKKCVRLYPYKIKGEGHFLALLHKKGELPPPKTPVFPKPDRETLRLVEAFLGELGISTLGGEPFRQERVEKRGEKVFYLPDGGRDFKGLSFLRNGLYLGDLKKDRFEPSQPLAMTLLKGEAGSVISLPLEDERINRYLKGVTIPILPGESSHSNGWHLLCVEGYPLGFGKLVNGTLKNKYPQGWRLQ